MEDIRPTAKWANRMLRPLTSVYRRLKKHQESLSFIANTTSTSSRRKDDDLVKARGDAEHTRIRLPGVDGIVEDNCSCDEDDPSWIPGKTDNKRRIKHKYSSRCDGKHGSSKRRNNRLSIRSPELQRTLPGAIEIATPLITGRIMLLQTTCLDSSNRERRGFSRNDSLPPATAADNNNNNNNPELGDVRKTVPRTRESSSCPTYKGSWKEALDMSGDTGLIDIARFLDRIFINFLNNTIAPSFRKERGARSLLSMAVRRLPEFIDDEQKMQDGLEENIDVDMCDAYFTELEAHYAPSGNGWKPLREAVRAQGIHLVSEVLRKNWVTKMVAHRLLEDCLYYEHLDAFETLLSKYLLTIHTCNNQPTTFDPSRWPNNHDNNSVRLLRTYYSSPSGRRSFVFHELAKLLLRGAISPEWMVTTSWKRCVDEAIQSLSTEDDDSAAAIFFIQAVVLSASSIYTTDAPAYAENMCAMPPPLPHRDSRASVIDCPIPIQDALSNLVLSLIAALCGMHIVRSQTPPVTGERISPSTRMGELVRYLALAVQRDIEIRPVSWQADIPKFQLLRRGQVLLGNCLLQCADMPLRRGSSRPDLVPARNIELFYLSLANTPDMVKELSVLVRQVICCYERASKCNQPRVSQEARNQVSRLMKVSSMRGLSTLLGKVAVETAMSLAEATLDPDDHVWAAEIQDRFASYQHQQDVKRNIAEGPEQLDNHDATGLYRWEEGMDEWVLCTPMPKIKAMPLRLTSKPQVVLWKRRSITSCSTSSSAAPSASPSQDSTSSFTSSAPSTPSSLSLKRGIPGSDDSSSQRSSKRLRSSARVRIYAAKTNDWLDPAGSETSNRSSGNFSRTAASYREHRGALSKDPCLAQTVNEAPVRCVAGAKESSVTPPHRMKIEVVISNKKESVVPDESVDDPRESADEHNWPCENPVSPSFSKTGSQIRGRVPSFSSSIGHMKPTIPCSQDDESEDELNFLV